MTFIPGIIAILVGGAYGIVAMVKADPKNPWDVFPARIVVSLLLIMAGISLIMQEGAK